MRRLFALKIKFFLLLALFIGLYSSGTCVYGETRTLDDILHPLGQDITLLEGEDGKITQSVKLSISDSRGDVYRFKFKSEGIAITGFAVIPRCALEGKLLPVLIYGRGGAASDEKPMIREPVLQNRFLPMAVRNNYIILAPEARSAQGSDGKDEWGGREMNDISAMLKLARSLPYVQKENVFFMGLSRGGTRAYLLAASEVPFSGIIAIAGVSDFFSHFPSNSGHRKWIPKQFGLGLKESFIKMSAIYWPEKIKKPLLIIHGNADSDVPPSQSRNLVKALEKTGAPFTYVEMNGAEHHLLFSRTEEFEKIAFSWLNNLKK